MVLTGIIIGVSLWIIGLLVFFSDYLKDKRCTGRTTAVILDVTEEVHWSYRDSRPKRKIYYYPIVEFSTPHETIRVRVNSKAYLPDTYTKGEKLNIRYNPKNPYDVKREGSTIRESAVGMIFFFVFGAVICYLGIRAG